MKIDKNIPFPTNGYGKWRELLKNLEEGDSFLLETLDRANAYNVTKKYGLKITIRITEEGLRAWVIGKREIGL